MLDIAAFCLAITALLSYLNHRFVGLPTAIGVMVTALASSLAIVALSTLGGSRLSRFRKDVESVTGHMGDAEAMAPVEEAAHVAELALAAPSHGPACCASARSWWRR